MKEFLKEAVQDITFFLLLLIWSFLVLVFF
jgi:hypothetical protein